MDKRGTGGGEQVVDLTQHWSAEVPANDFEWISGVDVLAANLRIPDEFLVKRPGPVKHVPFPDVLWEDFYNLSAERKSNARGLQDKILRFANKYGQLHRLGRHFHRLDDDSEEGEPLFEWKLELQRFQDTFDLWQCVQGASKADVQKVRKYCEPLYHQKPDTPFPLRYPTVGLRSLLDQPLLLAEQIVVHTINYQLAPKLRARHTCEFPGCGFAPKLPHYSSQTRGVLRSVDGRAHLAIVSTDLLTTVWLQLAAYVAGQRKAKKCEAPDCGLLMDVTDSPRPGARRMHPKCEERLRKRRYRDNKRKEGEL